MNDDTRKKLDMIEETLHQLLASVKSIRPALTQFSHENARSTSDELEERDEEANAFLYQMPTALHETDSQWEFCVHYSGDIFAIDRSGRSGRTEIHVLSAASNYQTFTLQVSTALHATNTNWSFGVSTNRDLFAFAHSGASNRVEVHVLTAASQYQTFRTHAITALHSINANWVLRLGPDDDLYAVTRQGASGNTEVHVMRSGNSYATFAFQSVTGLHRTGTNWSFEVSPNRDLCCALHRGASGRTEIHVLSAETDYSKFVLHAATGLHPIDASWDFAVPQPQCPGFIQRKGTRSRKTEVHVPALVMPSTQFERDYFNLCSSMDRFELEVSLARCGIDVAWGAANGGARLGVPGAVIGGATALLKSRNCQRALSEHIRDRDRERFERMDRTNHELERWERDRDIA